MATNGEQAAARLVERLITLETEFDNLVDAIKTEYHDWWEQMSHHEMEEFVKVLGFRDPQALRQWIITRGEETRTQLFPDWMLED